VLPASSQFPARSTPICRKGMAVKEVVFPGTRVQFPPPPLSSEHTSTRDSECQNAHKPPSRKGVLSFQELPISCQEATASVNPRPGRATESATGWLSDDPDLAAVVAAWDRLPAAVRAGIVAMVRAVGK
jgi:hypothetical protein